MFASEIKALLPVIETPPELNPRALDQLMTFWSPVSPETVFSKIFEVSPGEMLVIHKGKISKKRYWDWEFPEHNDYAAGGETQLIEELHDLLIDATKLRLRSDVPVGAYLSGEIGRASCRERV